MWEFFCKFENAEPAFLRLNASARTEDSVHVGTIHGAKGLEWQAVVIMGCEDDCFLILMRRTSGK